MRRRPVVNSFIKTEYPRRLDPDCNPAGRAHYMAATAVGLAELAGLAVVAELAVVVGTTVAARPGRHRLGHRHLVRHRRQTGIVRRSRGACCVSGLTGLPSGPVEADLQ